MAHDQIDIKPAELLTVIHNNMHQRFFEMTKNDAKQLFLALSAGKEIPFLEIATDNHGEVTCKLTLDYSEYQGKLNFSGFRNALAAHLHNIAEKIQNKEEFNILSSPDTGELLFNVPGIVETDGEVNILVTGLRQKQPGVLVIRLMFLDPRNIQSQAI